MISISAGELEIGDTAKYEAEMKISRIYGLGRNPAYRRPLVFAEASYAPTLPRPLYPTYKGCGPMGPSCRSSHEPQGLAGLGRLAGLGGGALGRPTFPSFEEWLEENAGPEPATEADRARYERAKARVVAASYVWLGVTVVGTGLSAYHGYRRNRSVGWAIVWGLFGGIFPIITPAVAFGQGFGKRKGPR